MSPLADLILKALQQRALGLKASDLATELGRDRREINQCLADELTGQVQQGNDYRWRLIQRDRAAADSAPVSTTAIAQLCRYYLECISQDMDEGVSEFASNQYGNPDYAQLTSVPIGSDWDWWNVPGVGRLLSKVRKGRGKLAAFLGYPVRLRQHRTPRWQGFFVEPVLMWPVMVPEAIDGVPSIDVQSPLLNTKFLRSVAMGDRAQLALEAAKLSDELGLSVPAAELPEIDELMERLVRIRPDWDWRERIEPSARATTPSLANLSIPGIYNCAVVVSAERSPYTLGLETELTRLCGVSGEVLKNSVLRRWIDADIPVAAAPESDALLEVLPMNNEQRAAVRMALTSTHTVVTGPPGTGKSQVVTNLLVNAAWRGMKVLFASKNNKAVDVVEARVNGLANRPVLLRLGAREYQTRLSDYSTQLLSGNPGPEVHASYREAFQRHQTLAARLVELDGLQEKTLDQRNTVDRLDAELEARRQLFGSGFATLTAAIRDRAEADLARLKEAIDGVDTEKQPFLVRLFWAFFRTRRELRLTDTVGQVEPTFAALGLSLPVEAEGISDLLRRVADLSQRLKAASKVVLYKEALLALQQSVSLETIAKLRAELAEQVSENSEQLWKDWVQLAPTRLTDTQRKDIADYVAALQLMTSQGAGRVHPSVRQQAKALHTRVTGLFACWAVTSLSAKGRVPLEPGFFDLVVIDEASQCDIASVLPLIYRAKRSVVIGDPMQLRHISTLSGPRDSELQHKHGLVDKLRWSYSVSSVYDLGASIAPPQNIISLRDHHRSHGDIIEFSNKEFYEGRLRVATRYPRLKRPNATKPGVQWQDVSGSVRRPHDGGAENAEEARAVVAALIDLLVTRRYLGSVGVVTPFRAQAQLLQSLVDSSEELEGVADQAELLVDTVHRFQGDERDVMFFSPVVSSGISAGALGFLRSNGNLFNVAITRARGLLHVVGDMQANASCGVGYLEAFVEYVSTLKASRSAAEIRAPEIVGLEYPPVTNPERVSDWERLLYRAMVAAGLKPIPQLSVEQYDLDFALIEGNRRLAIEVDGERYHKSWTGDLCLRDQLRNQRLIELGWDVRRFWVYEIRDDLQRCVQILREWTSSQTKGAP